MEWISVDDRLPEESDQDDYIVIDKNNDMYIAILFNGLFFSDGYEIQVTNWMPLPEPPK